MFDTIALLKKSKALVAPGNGVPSWNHWNSSGTVPVARTRIPVGIASKSVCPSGDSVMFGAAGGLLQSHRLDFPRTDVARVGWVTLPRIAP